tara:strand:+ start:4056 stop:5087 length:1032 start_codon:yes stop_codon:yes gene_type:complete
MSSNFSWSDLLEKLLNQNHLSSSEAESLINAWLNEELTAVQTGAFLAALRAKPPNGEELSSMAKILIDVCEIPCERPNFDFVDTCGTGGDGANTFNISTAVAFVSASCGARVAKHGNKSASGNVGSADVLSAAGLSLDIPHEKVIKALESERITFLFAPAWHKSLASLAPLRKSLGIRTVFNLLGPLVNPLRPNSQVLGVAKRNLLDPMALALSKMSSGRSIVVFGAGGLDEASLEGDNELRLIENGQIKSLTINASKLGLENSSNNSLRGGDVNENRLIFQKVLNGTANNEQLNVVALNTALVLWASNIESDLSLGIQYAKESMNKKKPLQTFNSLQKFFDN